MIRRNSRSASVRLCVAPSAGATGCGVHVPTTKRGGRTRGAGAGGRLGGASRWREGALSDPFAADASADDQEDQHVHEHMGYRPVGFGGADMERQLCTYVNSRKCAQVSSKTRGVLGDKDGRFAVSTEVGATHTVSVQVNGMYVCAPTCFMSDVVGNTDTLRLRSSPHIMSCDCVCVSW